MQQIKTFYFGEFGYFNFIILGRLHNYLSNNDVVLEVATYTDYYRVLKHVFRDRVVSSDVVVTLTGSDRDKLRCYHDNKAIQSLEGYTFLPKLLDAEIEDWVEGRKKITPLKQPIIHPRRTTERFVSISARKRLLDPVRNMSEENWYFVIDRIRGISKYRDCKIIVHGLRDESVDLKIDNSLFCEDIIDSIFYLNHSWFFLASMSGFGQFASNCNCNLIQIGPEHNMIPYNPFGKINICVPNLFDVESVIQPGFLISVI
jgi:hypothetical protein